MIETPSRILVVDDEPSITEFVSYALKKEGYETDVVDNGEDAFALASANNYDLFILDIMLPGKDGFELLGVMKKYGIPVIYITAKADVNSKIKGLRSGSGRSTKCTSLRAQNIRSPPPAGCGRGWF